MNDAVLLELARRWKREAEEPTVEDGSDVAREARAFSSGRRETLRECADALELLVQLLGGSA